MNPAYNIFKVNYPFDGKWNYLYFQVNQQPSGFQIDDNLIIYP